MNNDDLHIESVGVECCICRNLISTEDISASMLLSPCNGRKLLGIFRCFVCNTCYDSCDCNGHKETMMMYAMNYVNDALKMMKENDNGIEDSNNGS